MKKIGIMTLNGNDNYGNKLQNYALKKVIEEMGATVETIWYETIKQKIERHIRYFLYHILNKKRRIKFINFSKKYLNTKYLCNKRLLNKYDYIVVGSDQVWNYTFNSFDEIYLLNLDFIPDAKKISYAASIGVEKIDYKHSEIFKKGLSKFSKLSVRESSAKQTLTELTSRKDIEVSLDPTLLLSKDDWDEISVTPRNLPKKYVLLYYLGKLSQERYSEIEKYARSQGCEIINPFDKSSRYYKTGPDEFIGLIKNANLVCTDSFHASIFSFIYEKPFIIFDREDNEKNMSTRIDMLISTFKLKNRKYKEKGLTQENLKTDYKEGKEILKSKITESKRYLKNAIK